MKYSRTVGQSRAAGARAQVRVHQVDTVMRMELENLKLAVEKGKKAAGKKGEQPLEYPVEYQIDTLVITKSSTLLSTSAAQPHPPACLRRM